MAHAGGRAAYRHPRSRRGLHVLPLALGLGVALGAGALSLGFVGGPRRVERRGPQPAARLAEATGTLTREEEVDQLPATDERPFPEEAAAQARPSGFGLGTVLDQQLYDERVKEETRFVRQQAKLPWYKRSLFRLMDDLGGMITQPIRWVQLARITKEVSAERVKYYKAIKGKTVQPEEGDGQPRQGLQGDIRGFKAGIKTFMMTYMKSQVIARTPSDEYHEMLNVTLTQLLNAVAAKEPYPFEPFHKAVRGPDFDYYSWGNRFFRPLIKYRSSRVDGLENLEKIQGFLKKGENVVLIANHQTEADPQVLSILLEMEGYEEIAEQSVFVAGHKVTTDPLAIPFSMGRNLLTIFSKKYLDSVEGDEMEAKANRNRQTVGEMQRLLSEGGNIFWVAPSGGRDRRDPEIGEFAPAKFDPQSVGLFNIMAKKAEKAGSKTHFFPLAMWTHRLVPPPEDTVSQVGEERKASRAAVGISFGEEVDPTAVGGRKQFSAAIEKSVGERYWALHEKMRGRK